MNIRFVASFAPIARDVDATRALYRDAIGITFEGEGGDYVYTERLDGVEVLPGDAREEVEVRFDRFETTAGEVVAAVMAVADIVDVRIDEPAIEDVVRKVYAGQLDLSAR